MKTPSNPKNGSGGDPALLFTRRADLYLIGSPVRGERPALTVNGVKEIRLSPRKFMVVWMLFEHAFTVAGTPVNVKMRSTAYISAQDILDASDAFQDAHFENRVVFKGGGPDDVGDVIRLIRRNLENAGYSKLIIGNGPNDHGYRLDVPPGNLTLGLAPALKALIEARAGCFGILDPTRGYAFQARNLV